MATIYNRRSDGTEQKALRMAIEAHGEFVRVEVSQDGLRSMGIFVSRTDILAALGAVDAPVEVPKKLGSIIGYKGQTYVRHAETDFEGWSASDATLNSDDDVATILKDGGTILSEGIEL